MVKEPSDSTIDIENLDLYYEDCVIGGPGAFIMTIKDREKFQEAIRTKLVLEVAGLTPERRIVPAAEKEPRVPCLIGEKKAGARGAVSVETIIQSRRTNNLVGRSYHDRSQRPRAGASASISCCDQTMT
jgi:hypothetical protein